MRLKHRGDPADVMAMFSATKQPPSLSEASLLCLCASLNAPVVRMDDLPSGPARCAVLVYAEPYGDLGLTVAVRSLEGGEVLVLRSQEPLPPDSDPAAGLEMAITYAEALGFVFDEDMLNGGQASHDERLAAFDHWLKLVGSEEVFAAPDVASPPDPSGGGESPDPERMPEMEDLLSAAAESEGDDEPVELELEELSIGDLGEDELEADVLETDGSELLLDDIAPLDDDEAFDTADQLEEELPGELEEVAASIRQGQGRRPAAAAMAEKTERIEVAAAPSNGAGESAEGRAFAASPLSKFRRPADDAAGAEMDEAPAASGHAPEPTEGADDAAAGGSALGRVKIVRMKKSKDGRASARGRVLASY